MEKIKVGILGAGRGIDLAHNLNLAGAEIVALCDIDYEKAVAFSKENKVENARIYADYKEMLQNEELDFVSIATVSGVHGEIALYCAEQGVNFLVEKPMAMSIDEADAVIAAAEKSG